MIDVLIIGSGGAGLSAALEAKKNCDNVVVLSKTYPTMSQTSQAQGGINAVLQNQKDSVQNHIDDTIKSAHNIGDIETIKYMCENSCETIQWLDDIGVPFSRDENNNIAQRKLGGASNPRACYSSDYTGLKILHTLYDTCLKEDIEFLNENMLLNFIVEDNCIKGVTALDIATSQVKQILAKTVVVAAGGYAGIYSGFSTNSTVTTGDAIAAALRVGAQVSNMEYIQFHPTALKGSCILISESARGEGGYLVTKDEKRFIDELQARDVVARAIHKKILEGEEVYLDLRHLGLQKIKETMPQEYDLALQFSGLKLDEDLIPIQPAAHYTMGGIKVDLKGQTNIQNLYAIGECSSNGVHGANRLGGNSLLEIVTFGRVVGKNVSEASKDICNIDEKEYAIFKEDTNKIQNLFISESKVDFYEKKQLVGKMFYDNVGLFRTKENLQTVLNEIKSWEHEIDLMGISDKSKIYNTNLKELIEFQNILDLCDSIVVSALARQESRGAHYRSDHPSEDSSFEKETLVYKKQDDILVELV
jgi:succinate dehydrogenase / fumarate reductase flavoprotein subunit